MKNYTITPSKLIIGGFDLKNDAGNLVAITVGESEAKTFALVPQMVAILNEIVDNGGMANEETLKLFLERNNLLIQ